MSFDLLKRKVGRCPFYVVELDLDFCANTYGVAPCTASIPATGTQKCFNCFMTCQDTGNFSKTTKTYKFCLNTSFFPIGENMFPCILDVDIAPTQIDLHGIGVSSSVTVTLNDFPHHDRGIDPYTDDRDYDPEEQGTFFGKLRARNPFMVGREMRVKTGYIDNDRAVYTRTRTYFIDKPMEMDASGRVKITGKGLLRFGDDENVTVPKPTRGYLASTINSSASSFTLAPTGVGSLYASASARVRIEDEVILYSSRSGDTFTVSQRGEDETNAAAHDSGKGAQQTYFGSGEVHEVIAEILVYHVGVDPSFIDTATWDAEGSLLDHTGSEMIVGTHISERTPVRDVLNNLLQTTGTILWYDEVNAEIRYKVVRSDEAAIGTIDEDSNILAGSLSVKDVEKDRVSRLVTYFGRTQYHLSEPRPEDALRVTSTIDADTEGENQYGEIKTFQVVSMFNISVSKDYVGQVHARMIEVAKQTPREYRFLLDAMDSDYKEGDVVNISTRQVQASDGTKQPVKCIITQCREVEPGSHFEYKARQIAPVE